MLLSVCSAAAERVTKSIGFVLVFYFFFFFFFNASGGKKEEERQSERLLRQC